MPLLRQLEFAFRTVAGIADPGHFGAPQDAGVTAPGYNNAKPNLNLEETARELLCSLGAARIANELRVEWNSRLKTAAGRADYREKLISLNPRLLEYPIEIDRTLRHELAHILAQFRVGRRKISPHGIEWRAGLCRLGNRRREALSQSAVSCANPRRAVCLSLSELSSGVSASSPRAPRGRMSCLLPQTQRRRIRSAVSITAVKLLLTCHVEREHKLASATGSALKVFQLYCAKPAVNGCAKTN